MKFDVQHGFFLMVYICAKKKYAFLFRPSLLMLFVQFAFVVNDQRLQWDVPCAVFLFCVFFFFISPKIGAIERTNERQRYGNLRTRTTASLKNVLLFIRFAVWRRTKACAVDLPQRAKIKSAKLLSIHVIKLLLFKLFPNTWHRCWIGVRALRMLFGKNGEFLDSLRGNMVQAHTRTSAYLCHTQIFEHHSTDVWTFGASQYPTSYEKLIRIDKNN